ncbi:TSUP family transporter [Vibrio sp. V27_P1S3P104]|uniref:TSUP family transporter n=1 Tax=unclassified Vibrio TaxID=2614977 RepID=UPI00137257B3|nr:MULTISPECIES: TSUP family transporter [unclassified Vibrio]NAW69362.1 TSUP family transporter [Vibrio sp. V28_P6S34P95]NAX05298.1 TSUP family transporter [Vibrio sp. V30_P3S12P165]NAX35869.1 TSUP family transporter [Vibrio sp. V29_P1S30P107]NAX37113.1 TSUP family transporter [Vibrio sp. V27_P1S3P104]NAX41500.1 TSUP family transporter [Vibrio sp. V26_P1S5P106]
MEFSLEILGLLFLVAGIAGFIDAMAGGGGLLTLPALLAAGVPPTQALATNKLQSSFGSFSATFYFVRQGLVSLKAMRLAIACSFVGAALGAEAVQYIDASLLTSLIPLLLIAISLYFLLAPQTQPHRRKALSEAVFALMIGGGIGFYDGFFGPGTGSIFTVCFVVLGQLGLVEATARTKVLNFTSNIAALIFFLIAGLPIWQIGLTMAVGGFIGARMGAKVVITKGQRWIRPLVITMSMMMALKLLWEQHHIALLSMFGL